jgi:hypothetical protein
MTRAGRTSYATLKFRCLTTVLVAARPPEPLLPMEFCDAAGGNRQAAQRRVSPLPARHCPPPQGLPQPPLRQLCLRLRPVLRCPRRIAHLHGQKRIPSPPRLLQHLLRQQGKPRAYRRVALNAQRSGRTIE